LFTGIIEEVGEVVAVEPRGDSAVLSVRATRIADDLTHGASIAVDGVCLTVVGWHGAAGAVDIDFDVMGETLKRSAVGNRTVGDRVNLERAVRADARLDGHVVQGHVDGTGTVARIQPDGFARVLEIEVDPRLERYLVDKGSVAVEGVSLTVSALHDRGFAVSLIPETLRRTTLGDADEGSRVNIEVDILAKHLERLVGADAGAIAPEGAR
jgi:riboflavin synthase